MPIKVTNDATGESFTITFHDAPASIADIAGLAEALASKVSREDYQFSRELTGYTGGGPANLDGLPTAGRTFGIVEFIHPVDGPRKYQLIAGTELTDSPGTIRPDDFDITANARIWKSL